MTIYRMGLCTLAMMVWTLVGSLASAQPDSNRPRGGGPRMSMADLAGQKSVQEELKLSSGEVDRLTKLAEESRGARRELRDLSEDDRRKKMTEMSEATEKKVAEIINPEQFKRLKQISLQVNVPGVFNSPQVVSALTLTDEQKGKIETISRETGESMRGLFQAGGDMETARKEAKKLQEVGQEKVVGLLTSEQQNKWKEMTGEPFKGELVFGGRDGRRNRN